MDEVVAPQGGGKPLEQNSVSAAGDGFQVRVESQVIDFCQVELQFIKTATSVDSQLETEHLHFEENFEQRAHSLILQRDRYED